MKNNIIYIILSVFIIITLGCQKDTIDYLKPDIKAGESVGTGINYYDYDPDVEMIFEGTGTSDELMADINDDASFDIRLFYEASESAQENRYLFGVETQGDARIVVDPVNTSLVKPIEVGDTIDYRQTTNTGELVLYSQITNSSGTTEEGAWLGENNIYIGVKINSDAGTLYGWVRIEIPTHKKMTIMETACTIPTVVHKK